MKNPDPAYCTLCRLLSGQACPERDRRADTALTSTFGPDDWHVLVATARREGIAPLLYHVLNEAECLANLPPDVQADLRQAYYTTTARNLLLYRELSRILTVLAAADDQPPYAIHITHHATRITHHATRNTQPAIPVVVLKGAALAATIYPGIGLRPIGDLDLLVPKERLAEALARLKALGYVQPYPEMAPGLNALASHAVYLQGGQDVHLAVELHWTLVGGEHHWYCPPLAWFWNQTETLTSSPLHPPSPLPTLGEGEGGGGVRVKAPLTLTPTAQLLYLCAHLMLQHGEARSGLRWFYDIYLLVEREGQRIQWDELVVRAREFRWAPAVYAALEGVRDRFCDSSAEEGDTWLPAGVLEALAEDSDTQASWLVARRADSLQTRATGVVAAASSLSPRARLHFLLAHAIPSPDYMRWRYKPHPSWLWPLCYLYRWLDILRDSLTSLWRMASRRWLMD